MKYQNVRYQNKHKHQLIAMSLKGQQGFTLIEFMVAAILGLIVLLAIGGAYVSTQRLNEVANSRVGRQQELRMASNMLIRDARIAGSFGCANVSSLTAGAGKSAGISVDQSSTLLAIDNDASYFNVNESAGDDRVFASRIVAHDSAVMTAVANGQFTAAAGSDVLVFNYGTNTQPLLQITQAAGGKTLADFELGDGSTFQTAGVGDNARVVLSSCERVDVMQRSQLTVNNNKISLGTLNIPMNKAGAQLTTPPATPEHFAVQATLSNLQTVVYAVGRVTGDAGSTGLYRFELLNDGSWSPPQLLSKNIATMGARFIYVTGCAGPASDAANESFKLGQTAFVDDDTFVAPPTSVELTVTPSATQLALNVERNASDNVSTNAADLTPIVLNATMRGANVCANR